VICLVSALAFHDLTDQMPSRVWVAIGPKAWRPRVEYPAIRIVRFPKERLEKSVKFHVIDGVRVPIFGVAKTLADVFRYRRVLGTTLAVGRASGSPSEEKGYSSRNLQGGSGSRRVERDATLHGGSDAGWLSGLAMSERRSVLAFSTWRGTEASHSIW
jgi:predicted transcriptional regulator of viral defense system